MKHSFLTRCGTAAICLLAFAQCQPEVKTTQLQLTNTAAIDLSDKAITIDRDVLPAPGEDKQFPLITTTSGDTIACQLNDLNEDGQWEELFFVADLVANATTAFNFEWTDKAPHYTIRTSARFGKRSSADTPVEPALSEVILPNDLPKSTGFQKYQTDGPSWENDKVGFRHYLDGRNAKDLFGKKVAYMSPENVGINAKGEVEDNYHVMEDWGRDILAVGNSVGLGGYTLLTNDQPMRLGVTVNDAVNNIDKTTFHIVTEGPVKSVLNYHYQGWKPSEDRNYEVNETTTIWPGMYAYQNTVEFSNLQGDETLGIGLVNIHNQNPLQEIKVNDDWIVLLTHDHQTYDRGWILGMAIIVPRSIYEGYTEAPKTGQLTNTFLAKLKVENHKPVTYYAAAGWELADDRFKTAEGFKSYITNLVEQLSAQVLVEIR